VRRQPRAWQAAGYRRRVVTDLPIPATNAQDQADFDAILPCVFIPVSIGYRRNAPGGRTS